MVLHVWMESIRLHVSVLLAMKELNVNQVR